MTTTASWAPVVASKSSELPSEIISPLAQRYLGKATTGRIQLGYADVDYLLGAEDFGGPAIAQAARTLIAAIQTYDTIEITIEE